MLPGLRELTYKERLRTLELPSLAYRRLRGDMIMCYRILTGKTMLENHPFILAHNDQTRGHPLKLEKIRANTSKRSNTFFHRCVNPWNLLPQEVIEADTIREFEHRLDRAWVAHPLRFTARP
jgi:hypothetical protein